MPTFSIYIPNNERELHGIIQRELDSLEEGLELLKYEMNIGRSIPDFLCKDSGGRLVIIEVKLTEDENILFQALRYYSDVNSVSNKYAIAEMFRDKIIDTKQNPRLILIAKHFSDDIRLLSTLIVPDVELYTYTTAKDSSNNVGIFFNQVLLPKSDINIVTPVEYNDHRLYITDESIRNDFDESIKRIKQQGDGIEDYARQGYIGFKYKGRQLAWIATQRKSIIVGAHIIGDNKELLEYDSVKVTTDNNNIDDILNKISASYINLAR